MKSEPKEKSHNQKVTNVKPTRFLVSQNIKWMKPLVYLSIWSMYLFVTQLIWMIHCQFFCFRLMHGTQSFFLNKRIKSTWVIHMKWRSVVIFYQCSIWQVICFKVLKITKCTEYHISNIVSFYHNEEYIW